MTPHLSLGRDKDSSVFKTPQYRNFRRPILSPVNRFSPVKVSERQPTGKKQRLSTDSLAAAGSPRGEAAEAESRTRTRSMAGRLMSRDKKGSRIKKRSKIKDRYCPYRLWNTAPMTRPVR